VAWKTAKYFIVLIYGYSSSFNLVDVKNSQVDLNNKFKIKTFYSHYFQY